MRHQLQAPSESDALSEMKVRHTDTIGDRLKLLRKSLGATQRKIVDLTGISLGSLKKYEGGDQIPGSEAITSLEKTGCNLHWLLTGNGPMFINGLETSAPLNDGLFSSIPLYDVVASAGPGAAIDQENKISELAFRQDWLAKEGLNNNNLSAITADGDSMEPTIPDGSVLLIDISQRQLAGERIYVLRLHDHLYAKRLQRLLDGAIRVSSDNRAYADELVPAEELESLDIIGRVVWIGRRV